MATETAKFALELEDKITSGAMSAEEGLRSLNASIEKDTKALAQMKKAMRQMQSAGAVDIDAYRKLQSEIDATQNSIGKARAAFINLGGDFSKIGKKAKATKLAPTVDPPRGIEAMLGAAKSLPGPLSTVAGGVEGVASKMTELSGTMGTVLGVVVGVVAALAALAAILAAVAVATAKATVALLKYAAAQADAAQAERLRLQGMGTLRRWMRLTAKDASQMSESINRVSERVPLARSQVEGYGQELHRLGIRGRAAEDALEALSIAQAVQGDLGRRRLMMLVRQAGHSEGAMSDLARRVRSELGGIAAAQMLSLSMITTKLRESFQALFTGVDFGPLMSGFRRITSLLSQSTESGRALRAIFSTVLSAFASELGGTAPRFEYFLKEVVILALKVTIAFFRLRNAIYAAYGRNILGRMLATQRVTTAIKVVMIALGIVVGVLAGGIAILGLVALGLLTPFMALAAAVYYVYQATRDLVTAFPRLIVLFDPALWMSAGRDMISGIVAGLMSGADQVRAALANIASGALGAFRSALGIASPSAAFAELGVAIPQGVAQGIEGGASEATGAAESMMSTTTNNVASVAGSQSQSVNAGGITINITGGEGGEDTAERVVDALRDYFENALAMEPA